MTLPSAWRHLRFFSDHWPALRTALDGDPRHILPPRARIFAALAACPPDRVRVIVLGQDPYPTPGHPNGLAFSTAPDVTPLPASLRNIYQEMQADIGSAPANGNLQNWADQGVLLLNTALTVPAGEAGGHLGIGWRALTDEVLDTLDGQPRALLLWGRHAQRLAARMKNPDHLRIETSHPSPLSAYHSFFGSRPFSRINDWLMSRGEAPLDWTGS